MLHLIQNARPELEGIPLGMLTMRCLALASFDLNLDDHDRGPAAELMPKYGPLSAAVMEVMKREGLR
jgi:hypothetical protein